MENIFVNQPEFITEDPRRNRPDKAGVGYKVTPEFMHMRHSILLPQKLIAGKRILDLGSCNAASGAWCLSHGAAFYKGIEFQEEFVEKSVSCLSRYYDKNKWSVEQTSIENFLESNEEFFDVILAAGILYGISDTLKILTLMSEQADCIVIESMHTNSVFSSRILSEETKRHISKDKNLAQFLENESYIAVGVRGMVFPGEKTIRFNGFNPSMGALKFIFSSLGFDYHDGINQRAKMSIPKFYNPLGRYGMLFIKNPQLKVRAYGFASAVDDSENIIEQMDWDKLSSTEKLVSQSEDH
jgi:hypothetical protein